MPKLASMFQGRLRRWDRVTQEFQEKYARDLLHAAEGSITMAAHLAEKPVPSFRTILEKLNLIDEAAQIKMAYAVQRKQAAFARVAPQPQPQWINPQPILQPILQPPPEWQPPVDPWAQAPFAPREWPTPQQEPFEEQQNDESQNS